jgi:hypothetical protein
VLGGAFEDTLDATERRRLGAHYTSERDVLAVLRPLFLDELRAQLDEARGDRLLEFQRRLRRLRVFDPACGAGNFLVLAYRELRRLETEALVAMGGPDVERVGLDQLHGIELLEAPVRIAEAALRLTDERCDLELAAALERSVAPRGAAPDLRVGNALAVDWRDVLPPGDDTLVVGNPPFVGKKEQSEAQKEDMRRVWGDVRGAGVLDYVACWYRRAADHVRGTRARCAFVSTSSIAQGEQAGVLWAPLRRAGVAIHFARRSFDWTSDARRKAQVDVVVIGFGAFERRPMRLYDEAGIGRDVTHINAYLIDGPDVRLASRAGPLCAGAPAVSYGSFALDGGHYTLSPAERDALLAETDGAAAPLLRRFVGSQELIRGRERWCLWLADASPEALRLPAIRRRVEAVRAWRARRGRAATRALADTPALFAEIRQPATDYLAIPTLSSERRACIPIAFLPSDVVASNQIYVVAGADLFHFGVLTSRMHMAWVRAVCGRLESRYRYSATLYNNFPWPDDVSAEVVAAARGVLDARAGSARLADLYDPRRTPPALARAHAALDRAVDRCYRAESFSGDRARVELLFHRFERLNG